MAEAPLFILAPPRTFTSVICAMIGQHPQMMGLPEVNLFVGETYEQLNNSLYRIRPGFQHGLLRAVAELGLGGQDEQNIEVARTWLAEHGALSTAEIYLDLADWAAPRRLVDKSPAYVYRRDSLDRMLAAFPDARFLHLTRHPRSTCESIFTMRNDINAGLAKFPGFQKFRNRASAHERLAQVEDPESLWLNPHQRIDEFLAGVPADQHRRLRGEDFLSDPARHLCDTAEWLGVRTDDEALKSMLHPERSPFACFGPGSARFGNDPSFLESPALRPYTPKAQSMDGPLKGSEVVLSERIREYAEALGYGE
jgi:hypothetical protein